MRKSISFRLSIRTAPSLDKDYLKNELIKYFDNVKGRYNAKVEILDIEAGTGYNAKALSEKT